MPPLSFSTSRITPLRTLPLVLLLAGLACTRTGELTAPDDALFEVQSEPPCDDCSEGGAAGWGDSFYPWEAGFHCDEFDPWCDLRPPSTEEIGRIRGLYGGMSEWARNFVEGRLSTGTLRIWNHRFVASDGRVLVGDLHHSGPWDAYARLHIWSGGMKESAELLDTLCHEAAHFKSGTRDESDPDWQEAYGDCKGA